MYIYILLKLFVEMFGQYFNLKLKYIFILFELIIIINYFLLLYNNNNLLYNKNLFIGGLIGIILFLIYRLVNYIFLNKKNLFNFLSKLVNQFQQEKIKRIMINPGTCKIVYYMIGMLPGNIGYGIYFGIQENGWYARVWFSSTRDIIFGKMFKWDSRIFFYNLFEKINENNVIILMFNIKEEILKGILRLLFILSGIREQIKKKSLIEYILTRILVFCYLSLFYFYAITQIQIINKGLLIIVIILEILFVLFIGLIIEKILLKDKENKYLKLFIKFIEIENIYLLIDPLNYSFSSKYIKRFFEINNTIGNKILGNSISLNILREYILFVNKNTKGYFHYNYNILTRMKIDKISKTSNIPGDILPRTRYVIINLKFIQYNMLSKYIMTFNNVLLNNKSSFLIPDYRLKRKKNLYLTLFEKTYSEVSILIIIYILRINLELNYESFRNAYYNIILKNNENLNKFEAGLSIFYSNNKSIIIKLLLAKMSKENPNLLNAAYFLHTFTGEQRIYDMEGYFIVELLTNPLNDKLSKIVEKIYGIKQYKKGFEIISKLSLFEEEGIIGNKNIVIFFNEIEKLKLNEIINRQYLIQLNHLMDLLKNNDKSILQRGYSYNESIGDIEKGYKIKFLDNFDIKQLQSFNLYELLFFDKLIILEIDHEYSYDFLLAFYYDCLQDLEQLQLD